MKFFPVQQPIKSFFQNESLEPRLYWGLRLGVATIIPLLWGVWSNRVADSEWMAFAAELLCWIELKGSLSQRFRLLIAGLGACLFTCFLGGWLGAYVIPAILAMVFVGFLSGLIRNLGDRGNGIAFVLNINLILNLAAPFQSQSDLWERISFTFIGATIAIVLSFIATFLQPRNFPYRRFIAQIWQGTGFLAASIKSGWDGISVRKSLKDIYEKELRIRDTINSSLHFFDTLNTTDKSDEQQKNALAQLRKSASLVALHLISIADEIEPVKIAEVHPSLSIGMHRLLQTTESSSLLFSNLVVDLKDENLLLLENRLQRLEQILIALEEDKMEARDYQAFGRILQLGHRLLKLMNNSVQYIHQLKKDPPSYQSYSLVKTLYVLNPKYLGRNLKLLVNFNSFTTKFALRLAIASGICVAIWKIYDIPYGHWMPFTVAVLVQPYFRATLKKAIDRVIGTILGAVAGGFLVMMPEWQWLQMTLLFVSSVLMVFYVRNKYAYAAFYMTIAIILLFEVNESVHPLVIIDRATITAAGSVIAIIAGYALLPYWDKEYLPKYLSKAINHNYRYFLHTYFQFDSDKSWVSFRQAAESANGNVYDSFNRYMLEPHNGQPKQQVWFQLIIENIRITHELNNHQMQQEVSQSNAVLEHTRLHDALVLFKEVMNILKARYQLDEPLPEVSTDTMIIDYDPHFVEKIILELKALLNSLEGGPPKLR